MKYILRTSNYNEANEQNALYSLLIERGIENPEGWLNATEENEHDPFLLTNMDKAVETLRYVQGLENPRIFIQADSDADGYTSAAIVNHYLEYLMPQAIIQVRLHEGKQHGITISDIPAGIDLVIIPDAGSNQIDDLEPLLADRNLRYIVLDHHEISDYDEVRYNNSNIVNSVIGNYPNPYLSGAGVALKFVQASEKINVICKYNMTQAYVLASVGIVADVMNIGDLENKAIIMKGLAHMNSHEFLNYLMKDRFGKSIEKPTVKDIGWTIGPNLNAVIRLGNQEQKQVVFDALVSPNKNVLSRKRGDVEKVVPLYEEAARMCNNVKAKQARLVKQGMDMIESEIEDDSQMIIYIDEERELPFELSGLIANKLMSLHKKPVMLLKHFQDPLYADAPEEWRGSARGFAAENFENMRDTIKGLTGVTLAEGHAFAHGVGIEKESFASFKVHLNDVLSNCDFNIKLHTIDLEATIGHLNMDVAKVFALDEIWGQGIEKPTALITDIPCSNAEIMGMDGDHIKIITPNLNVILFNQKELVHTLTKSRNYKISVIGDFSIDDYSGEGKLQLVGSDFELTENTESDIIQWNDF